MQNKKPRYGWTRRELIKYAIISTVTSSVVSAITTVLTIYYQLKH